VVLINTPPLAGPAFPLGQVGQGAPPKSVQIADLPLGPMPSHSLGDKIAFLGAVHTKRKAQAGLVIPRPGSRGDTEATSAVFRYEGRRYVADREQPIVDEAGNVVESLKDWRLTFVEDKVAIFSNQTADVVVCADGK
jgi:hypothetical protein